MDLILVTVSTMRGRKNTVHDSFLDLSEGEVRERFARVIGKVEKTDGMSSPSIGADSSSTHEPTYPARQGWAVNESGEVVIATDSSRPGLAALSAVNPGRRGVIALAMVAVVVALIAGFVAWQTRVRPHHVSSGPPLDISVSGDSSPSSKLTIAVAGRVRRPGLIRLSPDARVADAIDAAGGLLPDTDIAYVNLARKLVDGELVLIGITPSISIEGVQGSGASAGSGPEVKVNLNKASMAQLQTLPGIGQVLAQRIIDYRTKHGSFRAVTDLRKVEGIGGSRFDRLKDLVTV